MADDKKQESSLFMGLQQLQDLDKDRVQEEEAARLAKVKAEEDAKAEAARLAKAAEDKKAADAAEALRQAELAAAKKKRDTATQNLGAVQSGGTVAPKKMVCRMTTNRAIVPTCGDDPLCGCMLE